MAPRRFIAAFLCAAATAIAGVAAASPIGEVDDGPEGIRRCVADDGVAIYTDKACGVFRAQPAAMSGELLTRLAYEARQIAASHSAVVLMDASGSGTAAMGTYRDASEPLQARLPGRRAPASGCARSPRQLTLDLVGSFAMRDVNRVAESYHWAGMRHRDAVPVMKQLERLAAQPLADARFLAAWIVPGDIEPERMASQAGLMQLVFADGGRVVDMDVQRYGGCYFVHF